MWKCMNKNCGKEVQDVNAVKCPYCGYRILEKEKPPVVQKIKTD